MFVNKYCGLVFYIDFDNRKNTFLMKTSQSHFYQWIIIIGTIHSSLHVIQWYTYFINSLCLPDNIAHKVGFATVPQIQILVYF